MHFRSHPSDAASDDWVDVRKRVARLGRTSARKRVFGADDHRFRLDPPLSPADLDEAEAQFGISLPPEYRDFLLQVGAGGAGPTYGLFRLGRTPAGRWAWTGDGAELTEVSTLAEPFDPGYRRSGQERLWNEEPATDDELAYTAWVERWDELFWGPERTAGAICICHEGCAHRRWLVVSGPLRGDIWLDERASYEDLRPVFTQGGVPMGFKAWYLEWLAEAEAVARG